MTVGRIALSMRDRQRARLSRRKVSRFEASDTYRGAAYHGPDRKVELEDKDGNTESSSSDVDMILKERCSPAYYGHFEHVSRRTATAFCAAYAGPPGLVAALSQTPSKMTRFSLSEGSDSAYAISPATYTVTPRKSTPEERRVVDDIDRYYEEIF